MPPISKINLTLRVTAQEYEAIELLANAREGGNKSSLLIRVLREHSELGALIKRAEKGK